MEGGLYKTVYTFLNGIVCSPFSKLNLKENIHLKWNLDKPISIQNKITLIDGLDS